MNLKEMNIEDIKNALLGTIFADGSIGKVRTDGSRNGTNGELEINKSTVLRILKRNNIPTRTYKETKNLGRNLPTL